MPVNYYTSDEKYMYVQKIVMDVVKVFVIKLLYPDENYSDAEKRFLLANFDSGDEVAVRKSIETFKTSQGKFPFTAYNIGEEEEIDDTLDGSSIAQSGQYFSPIYNCYLKSVPGILTVPMISFFTTPHDYFQARSRIYDTTSTVSRVFCPFTLNGVAGSFPIDIKIPVQKGSLAFAFTEFLRLGKIYNLQHDMSVYFHYYMINTANIHTNYIAPRISPVDEILLSLFDYSTGIYKDSPVLDGVAVVPPTPVVTTTSPTEAEDDFDVSSPIIINFNVAMNESSVEAAIDLTPFFGANYFWNSASTQLIIDPANDLTHATQYTITINTNAKAASTANLTDDFVLTFTTN